MHCKDGRALEVSVLVSMAPGFLSGYTKIVRFLPRYLFVNQLPYPVRLWQDSSIFRPVSADQTESLITKKLNWRFRTQREGKRRNLRKVSQYEQLWGRTVVLDERDTGRIMSGTNAHVSAMYITTISPFEAIPFILPDTRGDRQLRIDAGGPINLTASFAADVPGGKLLF
jgi:SHR-binding domain of vacuolar-sorting associated protein 13